MRKTCAATSLTRITAKLRRCKPCCICCVCVYRRLDSAMAAAPVTLQHVDLDVQRSQTPGMQVERAAPCLPPWRSCLRRIEMAPWRPAGVLDCHMSVQVRTGGTASLGLAGCWRADCTSCPHPPAATAPHSAPARVPKTCPTSLSTLG